MKNKIIYVLLFIWPAMFSVATGQIHEIDRNRYSSEMGRLEASLEPGEKVSIMSVSSLSGKLYIFAGDDDKVVFEYKRLIKCNDESTAREYDDLVEGEMQKTPAELRLFLRAPNPAPWGSTDNSVMIEGELRLPPDCQLEIDAEYYDLVVEGPFTSLQNRATLGKMDISRITRSLIISGGSRDVNLTDITGEISVTLNNADINAQNLVTMDESARIKNEHGHITIEDIIGSFSIRSSYGKIRINGADLNGGGSRIIGSHCPIRVEVTGSDNSGLSISNVYDDVELSILDTIPVRFSLDVEGEGEMHITDLPVKPVIVRSNMLECHTGEGNVAIDIDVEESGNIFIEGTQTDR